MAHTTALHALHEVSSLPHRLTGTVRRLWGAYLARRAERTTVQLLGALDDRTLKDLGIDRSEIESVVYSQDQKPGRMLSMGSGGLAGSHCAAACH